MEKALKIFNIEATELLEEMESALIRLERSPSDTEAINSIFRAAHTIKGSAGIVGLEDIEAFTHRLEELLDLVREGQISVGSALIELMLRCRDHISHMVAAALDDSPQTDYSATGDILMEALAAFSGLEQEPSPGKKPLEPEVEDALPSGPPSNNDNWHISLRFGPDALRNGMDPISVLTYLSKLGTTLYTRTLWESMPMTSAMDPESCYLGFEIDFQSTAAKAEIENVFEFLDDDCQVRVLAPGSPLSAYTELIASLPEDKAMLTRIFMEGGALSPEDISSAASRPPGDEYLMDTASSASGAEARSISTIRVDIEKLDRLVNTVGELVISGASISQEIAALKDRRLSGLSDVLTRLIDEVRDSSMGVRMTPIWETFNRFRRMVRDICHDRGKDVELIIRGGDTELDRTVIERIKDPLVHLVRNSIDHGIETTGERIKSGKPARGKLMLKAYQDTGDIVIEVIDDGRGINLQAVLEQAKAKGLITEASSMSEQEIRELIFMPGFSTAGEVTNISGRGVGMDVVRQNIESLRGSVQLESTPGGGTTVRVRLPLTLAIIDGFLVTVGKTSFVIPMDVVVECMELTGEMKDAAHGRDHVNLRGRILPYIRLSDEFEAHESESGAEHILVVSHSGRSVGLLVDNLVGEISTVIKPLGRFYKDVSGLAGAAILGDGSVALIVDVPNLVKSARQKAL